MLEYLAGRFQLRSTRGREETACAGSIRGFAAQAPARLSTAVPPALTEGGRVLSPSRRDRPASSHVVQFDLQPTFLAPRVSHCRTKLPQNSLDRNPLRPVFRTPLRPEQERELRPVSGRGRSARPGPLLVLSRFPALHVDLCTRVLDKGPRVTALPAGAVLSVGSRASLARWGDLSPPTARSGPGMRRPGIAGRFVEPV